MSRVENIETKYKKLLKLLIDKSKKTEWTCIGYSIDPFEEIKGKRLKINMNDKVLKQLEEDAKILIERDN